MSKTFDFILGVIFIGIFVWAIFYGLTHYGIYIPQIYIPLVSFLTPVLMIGVSIFSVFFFWRRRKFFARGVLVLSLLILFLYVWARLISR